MSDDEDSFFKNKIPFGSKSLSFGKIEIFEDEKEENSFIVNPNFEMENISEKQKIELENAIKEIMVSNIRKIINKNRSLFDASFERSGYELTGVPSLIIDALLNPVDAHDLRLNLEELMPLWVKRHGERNAKFVLLSNMSLGILGKLINKIKDMKDLLVANFPRMD